MLWMKNFMKKYHLRNHYFTFSNIPVIVICLSVWYSAISYGGSKGKKISNQNSEIHDYKKEQYWPFILFASY